MRILPHKGLLACSTAAVLILAGGFTPAGAALSAPGPSGPCPVAHPKPVSPADLQNIITQAYAGAPPRF